MKISLIAALSDNRVIGAAGGLPWSLPDDMKRFMKMTTGHCVVMGRKTFDSMDRCPLPRRTNIVLSRSRDVVCKKGEICLVSDLDEALAVANKQGDDEAFVIGGEAIYRLALPKAHCLYLTRVHAEVAGEVYFPEFHEITESDPSEPSEESDPSGWKLAKSEHHAADERHQYSFSYEDWLRV